MVYRGRYSRGFGKAPQSAVDTATAYRFGVSLDLHDLGVHLLGNSFAIETFPPFLMAAVRFLIAEEYSTLGCV